MALLAKPRGCVGCPVYGDGVGFVPDVVKLGTPLVLLQGPGDDEEAGRRLVGRQGGQPIYEAVPPQPAVGATGRLLDRVLLPQAGLTRDDISLANVVRCRFKHRNELPPPALLKKATEHCWRAHMPQLPLSTAVLAGGTLARWAATGMGAPQDSRETKRTEAGKRTDNGWRGWALPWNPLGVDGRVVATDVWMPRTQDVTVLVSDHPAAAFRAPQTLETLKRDWARFGRLLRGQWPQPLPEIRDRCEPDMWQSGSTMDTEFVPETGQLLRYSWASHDGRLYVIEAPDHQGDGIPSSPIRVTFQNGPADYDYALGLGLVPIADDTMLMHQILHPDQRHSLDFLGSWYATTNRWKHLWQTNPRVYAAGDAWGTRDAADALWRELSVQPPVRRLYETALRPLVPIIAAAQRRGLRTNQARITTAQRELRRSIQRTSHAVHAAIGWPINLGSQPQVSRWLYDVERVHKARQRVYA